MVRAAASEVLAGFQAAPVFSALPRSMHEGLARHTRVVQLRAHDVLWREGDRATNLGLVLHGRVAVERSRHRKVMVDVAGPNELVGEVAFSLGAAYQFDVRCLRRSRVALVPARLLQTALRAQPAVAVALAFELAQEVLRLTRRLESLSAGTVSRRLARVLLGLTERFGTPFPGGTLMPVRLRREDLAALAATTLESVSRQISVWKRDGVLVPQPVGFLMTDLQRLRRLADLDGE
ncbi:MAG: Crp/Fnr family transcriptional regulator [Myxococcaceae bacterium]|nr:Crp/Fnr family transcriptional regulator [Myxococcaceae bacterium]